MTIPQEPVKTTGGLSSLEPKDTQVDEVLLNDYLGSVRRHRHWILIGVSTVVGALLGVIWHSLITLPSYTITDDRAAVMREYGLTQFFAADAWFSIMGVVAGVGIGIVSWHLFKDIGWLVTLIALGAALFAAVVCWQLGEAIGPSDFAVRVAAAKPGDKVMIDFTLHTPVTLLVWPFAAITPILLYSSIGRDEEEEQRDAIAAERAES